MSDNSRIIAIVGPTSAGKTGLGIQLAKKIEGEVVSADSRQVYRGLDLGSGKVTAEETLGVPHHLIDVADPNTQFTVHDFVTLGHAAIKDILERDKVPIVVGGTGMYVDALLGRLRLDAPMVDPNVRARLATLTLAELQDELQKVAPDIYETVDQKNPRRVQRALEIARSPRNEIRSHSAMSEIGSRYVVTWVGLTFPTTILNERISTRARQRLAAGLVDEAERLHAEGLSFERMHALGLDYRALARHLKGEVTEEEMMTELIKENQKYAKRQMTWFKRNTDITWFSSPEQALASLT